MRDTPQPDRLGRRLFVKIVENPTVSYYLRILPLGSLLLSVLGAFAYYSIFGGYALYDDEGYMMLTVKHVLDGHSLYDQVWTLYGPVYFFYKWLIHGLFGLPLTHDVVRLTAIVTWVATALVSAIATLRLTGSFALAALVQMLVTLHLATIVNEPGHPQELAALLTIVIVALPTIARGRPPRRVLLALGFMVAALTMTKVNLGLFIALGVWMSVLSLIPPTAVTIALRAVCSAALVALPPLLMRQTLGVPQAWNFAVTQALAVVAISTIALTHRQGWSRRADLVVFASSCISGLVLIALATLANGTTPAALLDCLIAAPARMPGLYVRMSSTYFPAPTAAFWAVAVALAVRAMRRWRTQPHVQGLMKLAFGIAALNASWNQDIQLLLARLTPFLWLGLLPAHEREAPPYAFARLVLCWVAVLQPLQAYPVAGSQAYLGTFLHVLVGALCVGDAVRWLNSLSARYFSRMLRLALAVLLLLVTGLSMSQLRASRQRYAEQVPLALPGATRLRTLPEVVTTLRLLTQSLRERSDTFLCNPAFSSLYFWTGKEPPTLDVLGHEMRFYSEERQAAMVSALLEHPRPMIVKVHFEGLAGPYSPFEARLTKSFKPLMQIGRYQLLVPR